MNLIDAIKSNAGLIRRTNWAKYLDVRVTALNLPPSDIIADDWEVQETKVEISSSQFWSAYSQAQKEQMEEAHRIGYLVQYPTGAHWDIVPRIARLLGLAKR